MKNLNVVIDTNIFLVSLSKNNKAHWLYQSFIKSNFTLLVSTEIVLEYEEIIASKYNYPFASLIVNNFNNLLNVQWVNPYYKWNIITADADDNKFVDCAVAGNADYIISNDSDFKILKQTSFPKLTVLTLDEFEQQFKQALL
jgi:putative PIN family toxin of toxin-antitoxin system